MTRLDYLKDQKDNSKMLQHVRLRDFDEFVINRHGDIITCRVYGNNKDNYELTCRLGDNAMVKIKFEYQDKYTNGRWNEQECMVNSLQECRELYGLGKDCDYRIVSVTEI